MDKDIFSKEQEQQILKALDAMDNELGIDKLDDESGLKAIFAKYPEKQKQQEFLRTIPIKSIRLYLTAAFSGGAALAGLAVAMIPALQIQTVVATRGLSQQSDLAISELMVTQNVFSKTDYQISLQSEDPESLRLELIDMSARAGLFVGAFPKKEDAFRLNLYGLDRYNVSHIPVWAKLGLAPSDYKNITVEISR